MATIGSKKKTHTALWITLIIIGLVIVLPISLLYILFFENGRKNLQLDDNLTAKEVLTEAAMSCLDDASTNHLLHLELTEQDLNQALNDVPKNFNDTLRGFLPQIYIEFVQSEVPHYDIHVPINCYEIFQTQVVLSTRLERGMYNNEDGFIFSITGARVGRLGNLTGLITDLLPKFISEQDLQKKLADANLHMTVSYADLLLFYDFDDLTLDLANLTEAFDSGQGALFVSLFEEFIKNDLFDLSFYENDMITADVDLELFKTNSSFCSEEYLIDLKLRDCVENYLNDMWSDGFITSQDHLPAMMKFLSVGSNLLSDEDRDIVDSYGSLATYGIPDKSVYTNTREAMLGQMGTPINELVANQISNDVQDRYEELLINGGHIKVELNEFDIHDTLKRSAAIGFSLVLNHKDDLGTGKECAFIMIDNFYINIVNGKIYLVFGLNMNGYETSLIMTTGNSAAEGNKIIFPISGDSMYFGNHNCSHSLFLVFLEMIADTFTGGDSWFKLDVSDLENPKFVIDFTHAITASPQLIALMNLGGYNLDDVKVNAIGESASDVGYLELDINLHH